MVQGAGDVRDASNSSSCRADTAPSFGSWWDSHASRSAPTWRIGASNAASNAATMYSGATATTRDSSAAAPQQPAVASLLGSFPYSGVARKVLQTLSNLVLSLLLPRAWLGRPGGCQWALGSPNPQRAAAVAWSAGGFPATSATREAAAKQKSSTPSHLPLLSEGEVEQLRAVYAATVTPGMEE